MQQLKLGDITIEVIQKKIKNIYLRVYPASGRIRVSAPKKMDPAAIHAFVLSKLSWIKKKMVRIDSVKRIQKEAVKKYISNEQHFFMGKSYMLQVFNHTAPPKVNLNHNTIELCVRPNTGIEKRKHILDQWYRAGLKEVVPAYIAKWEKIIQVRVIEFGIKKMKTRWGTCNRTAKRIWLNLELAKSSPECLEFIIVHEMVHLLERRHNKRFYAFMDRFLPQWKMIKKELNDGGRGY